MQRALMNTSFLQGKISHLHALHNRTISEYGELVDSLEDECQTLCDIIPQYKISATLEGEGGNEGVRKKKEVYLVEKLEHEMLIQYQNFLQLLRKLSKKNHPQQQALGSRLTAKLIPVASEFNHAERLLQLAVDYSNAKSFIVFTPCMNALSDLLDGHMITDATDYIVGAILSIVRKQSYAINPKMLNILLHIRIAMIDMHRKDFTEEKAKNKKMKKEDAELARQLQKTKARRDRSELAAKQTKVIHRMFIVYLRVIEASRSCSPEHQARVLAPTLEGLTKFAPLVNVEMFHLLMKALKELLDSDDGMVNPVVAITGIDNIHHNVNNKDNGDSGQLQQQHILVSTKLHALIAVASLAQKDEMTDAAEWKLDLMHFHEVLFRVLPEVLRPPIHGGKNNGSGEGKDGLADQQQGVSDLDEIASQGSFSTAGSLSSQAFSVAASMAEARFVQAHSMREWTYRVKLLLRAVDLMILSQKNLATFRVTAFVRRFLQAVPIVPPHIAIALLAMSHRLLSRYPSCASIVLGGDDSAISSGGHYNPLAKTSAATHSDASFTWELSSVLTKHYHPTLQKISEQWNKHYFSLSQHKPGQALMVSKKLDALGPYESLEHYDPSWGLIVPSPTAPGKGLAWGNGVIKGGVGEGGRGGGVEAVGDKKEHQKKELVKRARVGDGGEEEVREKLIVGSDEDIEGKIVSKKYKKRGKKRVKNQKKKKSIAFEE